MFPKTVLSTVMSSGNCYHHDLPFSSKSEMIENRRDKIP